MPRPRLLLGLVGLVGLVGLPAVLGLVLPRASADEGEWRLGIGGGALVTTVDVGGATGTGAGYEVRGRLGHGLSNTLELGVAFGYAHASDVRFGAAAILGQVGTLFLDRMAIALGVELRFTPGVGWARAFARTGPYVALRAGGVVDVRTSQALFTAAGLLLASEADDVRVSPSAGGAIGVEHRFGDHVFVAVEAASDLSPAARLFALTGEIAWTWY